MSSNLALLIAVLLLAGNAFFVGAEFAIISARRSQVEPLAEAGDRRARTVLWAMEHVSLMLACAQLGITVCSTSLGVVAEPAIAHLIEDPLDRIDGYVAHRLEREAQVLAKVRADGPVTIPEIVADLYADVREELHEVAAKSVWAHLRKLAADHQVTGDVDSADGPWTAATT